MKMEWVAAWSKRPPASGHRCCRATTLQAYAKIASLFLAWYEQESPSPDQEIASPQASTGDAWQARSRRQAILLDQLTFGLGQDAFMSNDRHIPDDERSHIRWSPSHETLLKFDDCLPDRVVHNLSFHGSFHGGHTSTLRPTPARRIMETLRQAGLMRRANSQHNPAVTFPCFPMQMGQRAHAGGPNVLVPLDPKILCVCVRNPATSDIRCAPTGFFDSAYSVISMRVHEDTADSVVTDAPHEASCVRRRVRGTVCRW